MMSATPIPRTLAMSYYADLDVSVLDELPPGRTPIKTKLVAEARREEVSARHDACRGPPGLLGVPADRGIRGAAAEDRRGNLRALVAALPDLPSAWCTAASRTTRSGGDGAFAAATSMCWWRPR
jgi:ATP-dependent DNA helicase RecG